ncbi:hypothetical protein MY10362_007175 [Beauveria mimosiformis]
MNLWHHLQDVHSIPVPTEKEFAQLNSLQSMQRSGPEFGVRFFKTFEKLPYYTAKEDQTNFVDNANGSSAPDDTDQSSIWSRDRSQTPLSDLFDDRLDESETAASSLASRLGVPLPPGARSEKPPVDPMLLETEVAEGTSISPYSSDSVPLLDALPPSEIALPPTDNQTLLGDEGLPDASSPLPDGQFKVDKLLGKWRYRRKHLYYLRWETGEHSFEPEEDIAEGIRTEFDRRDFTGFHEGAHIIKWTKARNGEAWYLVAFDLRKSYPR